MKSWPLKLAAAVLLAGCGTGAPIRFKPDALHPLALRVPGALTGCDLRFVHVRDLRESSTAGNVHGRPIVDARLAPWLQETLSRSGLASASDVDELGLTVDIINAYGQGKHTSMSFTTLLRVEHDGRSVTARGTHTVANFAFGEGEVSRGLLRSVELATLELLAQLGAACSDGRLRLGMFDCCLQHSAARVLPPAHRSFATAGAESCS